MYIRILNVRNVSHMSLKLCICIVVQCYLYKFLLYLYKFAWKSFHGNLLSEEEFYHGSRIQGYLQLTLLAQLSINLLL